MGMSSCGTNRPPEGDRDGHTRLQELEATEPRLFLSLDPAAPARLAQAIARRL